MCWLDRVWGRVIKKEGIKGGNTTRLMKVFKTVFLESVSFRTGAGWFSVTALVDIEPSLAQFCNFCHVKSCSLSCLNGDMVVLFKLTQS